MHVLKYIRVSVWVCLWFVYVLVLLYRLLCDKYAYAV